MKSNTASTIGLFEDLEDPQTRLIATGDLIGYLEFRFGDSYQGFSTEGIRGRRAINVFGDSEYGARMGDVKGILAQAIHSPQKFAEYLRGIADTSEQNASEMNAIYDSRTYRILKAVKLVPEKLRRYFGQEGNYRDDYVSSDVLEKLKVKTWRVDGQVYIELANVVEQIGEEFDGATQEDILRLTELNHPFSGRWNDTGRDLTFTDPKIRRYGVIVQQLVQRIWNADSDTLLDVPEPLDKEELFGGYIQEHEED